MSVPSKSIEKNKRYAGVKANDFVNKSRPTERTRAAAPSQGWANLGKINARRIPPPANVPSLKSETGTNNTSYDPIIPPGSTNHGWTGTTTTNSNSSSLTTSVPRPLTPSKQPTQQQLDSIPAHASTTTTTTIETEKSRGGTSWSHVTAGATTHDQTPPNLLGLNDFPRLVTQDSKNVKLSPESLMNAVTNPSQGPSFRPANLSSWKEGGGRVQPISSESNETNLSSILPSSTTTVNSNTNPSSSYMRVYSPQSQSPSPMWTYNSSSYGGSMGMNSSRHQSTRPNSSYGHSNRQTDYKTPTILRNKDIDDLSKLTDNVTWASASQEVNYEEKIRFSDDEENIDGNEPMKSRRFNHSSRPHQNFTRTRLLQDDEHVKQLQDDKNSELITTLTVAKQRRDEQERHLRPKGATEETSKSSRSRHDTSDSQQFAMKSWSDQMDSFNYASLHEKSTVNVEADESTIRTRKSSRSASESSSQSPLDQRETRSKHFPITKGSSSRPPAIPLSKSVLKKKTTDVIDYFDRESSTLNSNEQLNDWEDTPVETKYSDRRRQDETIKARSNLSRSSDKSLSSTKTSQPVWRPLSPNRPLDVNDPTPQESIHSHSQNKSTHDRRQPERKSRYTTPMNTSSIPPLMSVRSDVVPPSLPSNTNLNKHYKSSNYSQRHEFYPETNEDEYYEDDNGGYYDSTMSTHSRQQSSMGYHSHSHHRGYTTLGSYGRYRRGGSLRHQQQYTTYPTTNSSPLNTTGGTKMKKTIINRTNKKTSEVTEEIKPIVDESLKKPSAWTIETKPIAIEEIPIMKLIEPLVPVVIPLTEIEATKEILPEPKPLLSNDNESTQQNPSSETKKSTTGNASQKKSYQQQAPRHRNTYGRSMQDYESMPMNYYTSNRRGGGRIQDLSSVYYYNHSQSRYHNQYNYPSTEHYPSTRYPTKTNKRGNSSKTLNDRQVLKQTSPVLTSIVPTTIVHPRHHSSSDNEQKEGEEWETASESSTNMRNGHHENHSMGTKTMNNEMKSTHQDRTPPPAPPVPPPTAPLPKKSFANQRPLNPRHSDRRGHTIFERGNKSNRNLTHRSPRLPTKITSDKTIEENKSSTMKKDPHRHSLDGYDLNNVAGVVKIETLPAGALEEEGDAFDDGGEEFCLVMSKRDRKEQKAAQLSKQNAFESTQSVETSAKTTPLPSTSNDQEEQIPNEKSTNENPATRSRIGKSLPPRFNSKSSNSKVDSMYYYDQNSYYYYNQNQYYDQDSYYNYGNYNSSHRPPSTRRKARPTPHPIESTTNEEHLTERKHEPNLLEKSTTHSTNVMSNIDMWDPHTDNTNKFIDKSTTHERKYPNEIVPNETTLPLHQRTSTELPSHSPISKSNETIARTIKPPVTENKSDRETKTKSGNYEKNDPISTLGPNQLFSKTTFLDYDDKQSIGTVGDDYNQKINSLKTIWDVSDHPSDQLEQTINTMVAMKQQQQQHQENTVPSTIPTKNENYVKETITVSSANITGPAASISSGSNEEGNKKALSSTGSTTNMNSTTNYSTNSVSNKNEQKNICTVKPTQQVQPNIQDQVDVTPYPTFPVPSLPPPISQASLQQQQQQHLLSQAQVNSLHQPHSYQFYENLLPPPQQQQQAQQQQQQPPFNRIYSSNPSTTSNDPINSDFSHSQSSQIYPPQNFPYRNTNMYMQGPPPSVPNTNSIYHHNSQGSISAPPQNNSMPPPPIPNYPSPFLLDHGGHIIGQAQPPPPPPQGPPQAYMNNQMMSNRPQGGPYYRTPPQQTPPGPPPYATQDPLAHGGFYPTFFQAPNSNAPPVGHPPTHNIYGQNEGFHPGHPAMFARGGSIDRGDHPLMTQSLSRPNSFPSSSSNQQQGTPPGQQQSSAPPPSLLSQNLKGFPPSNQQGNSSVNPTSFYPPPSQPNQYTRQPMPIGAMNTNTNRQQNQQVPSLMSGLTKTYPNNGTNLNTNQSLFQHRQPLMPPQSNNNRSLYQHHLHYPSYSKSSTTPNDDNIKPKHI